MPVFHKIYQHFCKHLRSPCIWRSHVFSIQQIVYVCCGSCTVHTITLFIWKQGPTSYCYRTGCRQLTTAILKERNLSLEDQPQTAIPQYYHQSVVQQHKPHKPKSVQDSSRIHFEMCLVGLWPVWIILLSSIQYGGCSDLGKETFHSMFSQNPQTYNCFISVFKLWPWTLLGTLHLASVYHTLRYINTDHMAFSTAC